MLKLCDIVKNYPSATTTVHALRGVSLTFREHEFVAILGPSGCGKTTLLNIIGGLDRYTSGDLIIGGVSTASFDDMHWDAYRNATIGFVFQNYNLIPHLTVLENVELALSLVGEKKKVRRAKAIEALRKVGIEGEVNKRPNQLSGGQMQRVAIARAIVNDPKIILADEPTGALDSELSVQVMEILREISATRLVIMVTHNAELADKYATRICRFKDGQLIEDTNPYSDDNEIAEETSVKTAGEVPETISEDTFKATSAEINRDAETKGDVNVTDNAVSAAEQADTALTDEITADTSSLADGTGDSVHVVANAEEVDYDELAMLADDNAPKEKKVSNRKRKKQMKSMRVDNREIFDRLGLNSLSRQRKKKAKKDNTFKPTSMSAGMAFGLSIRNLISKKRRTFLTSFAGSIGIIGLGLVLAISNGFNVFVEDMQTQMLAGVPVGVYEYNVEASAIMDVMSSLAMTKPNENAFPDTDKITVKPGSSSGGESGLTDILSAFFKSVSKNELNEEFAEYMKQMPSEYYSARSIYYGVRYNLLSKITSASGSETYKDVSQQPETSTVMTIATSILGESGVQPAYWQVLVGGEDTMMAAYDMIDGTYPKNKNELLLCIGESNEIDQSMLDKFGISIQGIAAEDIKASTFIGKSFKLIDNNDYYDTYLDHGAVFFEKKGTEQSTLKDMYDNAADELKIVGVIRPKKDAEASYVSNSICYTPELAEYVVNKAYNSDIAVRQREIMETNPTWYNTVFGGEPLQDDDLTDGSSILGVLSKSLSYTSFIKSIGATKAPTYINIYPATYDQKIKSGEYIKNWNKINKAPSDKPLIGYFDVSEMFIYNLTLIIDLVSTLLIAVASISLVVSTVMIGVITSNSVIERTREIGILRALGARKRDIRNVFIAETSLIGLAGGLIGIVLTYILCPILSAIIGAASSVPNLLHFHPLHAFILVILSLVLTILSGILPAIGASRKNVVDALRVD